MMPMEKDHLEILLEDIRGKFELVLEGHESLSRKMDGRFDELNEKIEHNSFLIGTLNNKIDGVDKSLKKKINDVDKSLSARIDSVDKSLSARIDEVDKRLGAKIDGVDNRLSAKIDGVEKNLGAKIDAVAADLAAHRTDTEAHGPVYRVKESRD
jgi:predicted transcriptional regulator